MPRDEHEDQHWDNHYMGGVEPDQDRNLGGEFGGEPQASAAEQSADLEVVAERLEAFLVPFQDGAGEQGQCH